MRQIVIGRSEEFCHNVCDRLTCISCANSNEMKKVVIGTDEWYPVFDISKIVNNKYNTNLRTMYFTEEEFKNFKRCFEEFEKWQEFISNNLNKQDEFLKKNKFVEALNK